MVILLLFEAPTTNAEIIFNQIRLPITHLGFFNLLVGNSLGKYVKVTCDFHNTDHVTWRERLDHEHHRFLRSQFCNI